MRFISSALILLLFAIGHIHGEGTTAESVNPFNEFMSPQGGVDLLSGQVAFPYNLYNLRAANGMSLPITLSYSSNVALNVKARNDIAPTTWVGLGWALGYGSIKCDHSGTVDKNDDSYTWISSEGITERVFVQYQQDTKTTKYFLERQPYWRVTPHNDNNGFIDGWEIIDESGKRYLYGNWPGIRTDNNTVRNSFAWKENNFVGIGFCGTPVPFPYQWDLAAILDPYNNGFYFQYDQSGDAIEKVRIQNTGKPEWLSPFTYTKASYLNKIVSTTGETAEFTTINKEPGEYRDHRTALPEPDGFMEFYETRKLDKITIKNGTELLRNYKFCYKLINTFLYTEPKSGLMGMVYKSAMTAIRNLIDPDNQKSWLDSYKALTTEQKKYTKSLLLSIAESDAANRDHGKVIYSYFDGMDTDENILTNASATSSAYYFGAMKAIRYPQCGEVKFNYAKQKMNVETKKILPGTTDQIVSATLPNGLDYQIALSSSNYSDYNIFSWNGCKWINTKTEYTGSFSALTQTIPGTSGFFRTSIYDVGTLERKWECFGDFFHYKCQNVDVLVNDLHTTVDFWYWDEKSESFQIAMPVSNSFLNGNGANGNDQMGAQQFDKYCVMGAYGDKVWLVDKKNRKVLIGNVMDAKCLLTNSDRSQYTANAKVLAWEVKYFDWHSAGAQSDREYTWDKDNATQAFWTNVKVGNNFFVHYTDESALLSLNKRNIYIYSITSSGSIESSMITFDDNVRDVKIQEDYILVFTSGQGLYTIKYDGTKWTKIPWKTNNDKKIIDWGGDYVANAEKDFFAIYNKYFDNFTAYFWNGQDWINIENNRTFNCRMWGTPSGEVHTGNDFIVYNYASTIGGNCSKLRKKENFKVYQWFGGENWNMDVYTGKLDLGDKVKKYFSAGNDFFAGMNVQNEYYEPVSGGQMDINSCSWNGSRWVTGKIFSNLTVNDAIGEKDYGSKFEVLAHTFWEINRKLTVEPRFYDNPVIAASPNAIAIGLRVHNGRDTKKCDGWVWYVPNEWNQSNISDNSFNGVCDWNSVLLARKVEDKFPDYVTGFVCSAKVVNDGVTEKKSQYSYQYSNDFYNVSTRTAMFGKVVVTHPENNGNEVYTFHNGITRKKPYFVGGVNTEEKRDQFNAWELECRAEIVCKGKIKSIQAFNYQNLNKSVSGTGFKYEQPFFQDPSWPVALLNVRLKSTTDTLDGVVSEKIYEYADNPVNSSPKSVITTNSNGDIKTEETVFACEKYPALAAANLLTHSCQYTLKETKMGTTQALTCKSEVIEWNEIKLLPVATWKYKTSRPSATIPQFVFSPGTHQNTAWKKQSALTSFTSNGLTRQSENGAGDITTTIFGHHSSMAVAAVPNTKSEDCAFFPGDYDDDVSAAAPSPVYFDVENGWKNGGAVIGIPPVKHFGERAVHVTASQDGPNAIVKPISKGVDFIFSAWVYPVSVSANSQISLSFKNNTSGAEIKNEYDGSQIHPMWKKLSLMINHVEIETLDGAGATIKISSLNGADFWVEDIRFYPQGSLPTTHFYDPRYSLLTTAVDPNNTNQSVTTYDDYGRAVKVSKRDVAGSETILRTKSYHEMICNSSSVNRDLAKLTVNGTPVDLSAGSSDLSIKVSASTTEAEISAIAVNPDAAVEINGQENVCPCSPTLKLALPGTNTDIRVTVYDAARVLSRAYTLSIGKASGCWEDLPQAFEHAPVAHVFALAGPSGDYTPYVAGTDVSTRRLSVAYFSGGAWHAAGNSAVDQFASAGEASKITLCTYGAGVAVCYSDYYFNESNSIDNGGRVKVRAYSSGNWSDIGDSFASQTESYMNTIAYSQTGLLYVAYLADKPGEIAGAVTQNEKLRTIFVKKNMGGTWESVGSNFGIPVPSGATSLSLSIASDGTPYLAYIYDDIDATGPENISDKTGSLYVCKFNGSSWVIVGSGGTSSVTENSPDAFKILVVGSTPYIAYTGLSTLVPPTLEMISGSTINNVTVARFDGSVWQPLSDNAIPGDGQLGFDLFANDGKPAILFNSVFNAYNLCLIEYASDWQPVGFPIISPPLRSGVFSGQTADGVPLIAYNNGVEEPGLIVTKLATPCNVPLLSSLAVISDGRTVLQFPSFRAYLRNYAVKLDNDVSTAKIFAVGNAGTTVTINGENASLSGNDVTLLAGWNKVPITVSYPDDARSITYNVSIYRLQNDFANICSFELTNASGTNISYSPAFAPANKEYTASVGAEVAGLFFSATGNENAEIKIGSKALLPGEKKWIPLAFGVNHLILSVSTSGSESAISYVLKVNRLLDASVKLSALTFSSFSLNPLFSSDVSEYTVSVPADVATTQVMASTLQSGSSATLGTLLLAPDSWSTNQSLFYGVNLFTLNVANTAGENANYLIKVIRQPINTVSITELSLFKSSDNTQIGLTPATFSSNTFEYKTTVPETVDGVMVHIAAGDAASTVAIGDESWVGQDVLVNLQPGSNFIPIRVASSDGSSFSTYSVEVYREIHVAVPKVYFGLATSNIAESENGTVSKANIKMKLSSPPSTALLVNYQILAISTATPGNKGTTGADYQVVGNGQVTFSPCEEEINVGVDVFDDKNIENNETIVISLSIPPNLAGYTLGSTAEHTLTIIDDDIPTVGFAEATSQAMENDMTQNKDIIVTLSDHPAPGKPVTVTVAASGGTAVKSTNGTNGDFDFTATTLTFTDSDLLTKIVKVKIIDDNSADGNKTVNFDLVGLKNVKYGNVVGSVMTIVDIDDDIVYVDKDALGANNGQNWADAYTDLSNALRNLGGSTLVRVAEGVYKPSFPAGQVLGPSASFVLSGAQIYGGFAGYGAPDPNSRNWNSHQTVLSGDLLGNDYMVNWPPYSASDLAKQADNSYHVVKIISNCTIDGFIIEGGVSLASGDADNNKGAGIYMNVSHNTNINNCIIRRNYAPYYGGGISIGTRINNTEDLVTISNCRIENNVSEIGGGIYAYSSRCLIVNSIIAENYSTTQSGAGILSSNADMKIINCTISHNHAAFGSAGIVVGHQHLFGSTFETNIRNCIIWGNFNESGSADVTFTPSALSIYSIQYSCIKGSYGVSSDHNIGGNDVADNPNFFDSDYRLLNNSPCVDAGNNDELPTGVNTDIDLLPRRIDMPRADIGNGTPPIVDMGAHECQ